MLNQVSFSARKILWFIWKSDKRFKLYKLSFFSKRHESVPGRIQVSQRDKVRIQSEKDFHRSRVRTHKLILCVT